MSPIWQILYWWFRWWFFIWKIIWIWAAAFWLWFVIKTRWRFSESCFCFHRYAWGLLDELLPPFFVINLLVTIIFVLVLVLITFQLMCKVFQNIEFLSIVNGSNGAVTALILVLFLWRWGKDVVHMVTHCSSDWNDDLSGLPLKIQIWTFLSPIFIFAININALSLDRVFRLRHFFSRWHKSQTLVNLTDLSLKFFIFLDVHFFDNFASLDC